MLSSSSIEPLIIFNSLIVSCSFCIFIAFIFSIISFFCSFLASFSKAAIVSGENIFFTNFSTTSSIFGLGR